MKKSLLLVLGCSIAIGALAATQNADPKAGSDLRQEADFPPPIKVALKQRMRENLMYVNQIETAIAANDMDRAAELAEFKLGLSSLGPHNARQEPYMPEGMRHLGMEMHKASSRLARVTQEGDQLTALRSLSEVTTLCVACHATYRVR